MNRCRNCGNPAHKTQHCPRFGPWYPEPGKSRMDYADLADQISRLVAADILAEHEGHSHDGEEDIPYLPRVGTVHISDEEEQDRVNLCPICEAKPGEACATVSGKAARRSHRARKVGTPQSF
jgi:hypothetical protein